ncbi:MAG: hypothetical protein AAF221_10135 [Pseudomonadota bacterium]
MTRVSLSIRVTSGQHVALKQQANRLGIPIYQVAIRALEKGLADMTLGANAYPSTETAHADFAEMEAHLQQLELLLERTLFVASAGYVYARHAALAEDADFDASLTHAAEQAFARQKAHALRAFAEDIQ